MNLYYKIEVTKKFPAPVQNLKDVAKLAFGGESGAADRIPVEVQPSAVCAGRQIDVEHVPSDMMVKALIGAEDDTRPPNGAISCSTTKGVTGGTSASPSARSAA